MRPCFISWTSRPFNALSHAASSRPQSRSQWPAGSRALQHPPTCCSSPRQPPRAPCGPLPRSSCQPWGLPSSLLPTHASWPMTPTLCWRGRPLQAPSWSALRASAARCALYLASRAGWRAACRCPLGDGRPSVSMNILPCSPPSKRRASLAAPRLLWLQPCCPAHAARALLLLGRCRRASCGAPAAACRTALCWACR